MEASTVPYLLWLMVCSRVLNAMIELEIRIMQSKSLHGVRRLKEHPFRNVTFRYYFNSTVPLEAAVIIFCEENAIGRQYCSQIIDTALGKIDAYVVSGPSVLVESMGITADCADTSIEKKIELEIDERIYREFMLSVVEIEGVQISSSSSFKPKVCFIHSCSLPDRDVTVLFELLDSIERSGLMGELHNLWVINYGLGIRMHSRLAAAFPKVSWIQRSNDTSLFEVPTMRHMQAFAQRLQRPDSQCSEVQDICDDLSVLPVTQVLYLHTKGVSYNPSYLPIQHWRKVMLYFLVEKYRKSAHLLDSGEFDATGVNYKTGPRHYSGNFWWATAFHLARLSRLQLGEIKYEAEFWLLSGNDVRAYILHESRVDHYEEIYPPEKYIFNGLDDRRNLLAANGIRNAQTGKLSATCSGFHFGAEQTSDVVYFSRGQRLQCSSYYYREPRMRCISSSRYREQCSGV